MFNLGDFIMMGLRDSVGKLADYQVILNATGWFEKGVLDESNLAELNEMIVAKNYVPPEPGIVNPEMV